MCSPSHIPSSPLPLLGARVQSGGAYRRGYALKGRGGEIAIGLTWLLCVYSLSVRASSIGWFNDPMALRTREHVTGASLIDSGLLDYSWRAQALHRGGHRLLMPNHAVIWLARGRVVLTGHGALFMLRAYTISERVVSVGCPKEFFRASRRQGSSPFYFAPCKVASLGFIRLHPLKGTMRCRVQGSLDSCHYSSGKQEEETVSGVRNPDRSTKPQSYRGGARPLPVPGL